MYKVTLVWLNNIKNMQVIIQLAKCACITILQLLGQTDWQGLNLLNPKAFLSVVDWRIGANFKLCLDLTLTYNILSGHILATVRIWIAATDYYMYFYIIVIFPLRDILQLINLQLHNF